MFEVINGFLVAQKDLFSSLASISTVLAFIIPLPIFVVSELLKRHGDYKERALNFSDRFDTGEARLSRNKFLKIVASGKLNTEAGIKSLTSEENEELRFFMNRQESLFLYYNTSSFSKKIFLRAWKSALIRDWEKSKLFVYFIRDQAKNENLYIEWETAIKEIMAA